MSQEDSNQTPESQSSVAQSQTANFISSLKNGVMQFFRSPIQFLNRTANSIQGSSEQTNPTVAKIVNFLSVLWEKFLPIWNQLLKVVRGRLSPEWNEKLGDRVLSGILASAIVLLFWVTTSLFSAKPPQPQIANRPPLILPNESKSSFPSDLSTPATEVVTAPVVVSEPETVSEPSAERSEPIVAQGDLAPNLTPEERRIAAIEAQVIEISDRFISGLVVSVEQNEPREQMKVTVSDDWYRFNAEQQDRFANELWTRSQTFKLPNLEIRDPQGVLLARPPIVGDLMVVVKRKRTIA